jgi:hypothetical protein
METRLRLEAVLRQDLAALNRAFIGMMRADYPAGLEEDLRVRLRGLDAAAAARLAELPFALFSFGFDAAEDWQRLLAAGVRERRPARAADPGLVSFTVLALAFSRQACLAHPSCAATWVGLPRDVGAHLVALGLGALGDLAPLACLRLRCRFARQPRVWASLVEACERDDRELTRVVCAMGLQWTIRRALGLGADSAAAARHGFRSG